MILKNFVRAIRDRSGLTQVEFGRKIGIESEKDEVFQTTISKYERGSDITIDVVERMLRTVNLTLSQCLNFPEDRKKNSEAHKMLDRLLAGDRRDEILRYLEFQDHQGVWDKEGPQSSPKTGTGN